MAKVSIKNIILTAMQAALLAVERQHPAVEILHSFTVHPFKI